MKLKLLFFFLFAKCICFSQVDVSNFFSTQNSMYAIVSSSTTIDESTNGNSLIWDFINLIQTGTNQDTYSTPTSSDISSYPGTTLLMNTKNLGTMEEGKFYIKEEVNAISITGFLNPDLTLNYSTDNALLGSYPLSYVDAITSDPVAGNYNYTSDSTEYKGTFTGVIETVVDAYGTLTTNGFSGNSGFSGNVTRIKSVQNLDLAYSFYGNVGTATLTTYNYYDDSNGNLVFRSNRVEFSVPLLSVNENNVFYESMLSSTLNIDKNHSTFNGVKIAPNPVDDFLNIQTNNNQKVTSLIVTDISGEKIIESIGGVISLPIGNLQTGVYFANIVTQNNNFTVKFIKR